jgi:hypothetical protein
MSKQVRESKAAQSVTAYVILKNGEHIATVQALFTNSGNVKVDVWDKTQLIHQGKADGYGYDKFTAALSGAVIDGIMLYNHCEKDALCDEILKNQTNDSNYWCDAQDKHGVWSANYKNDRYDSCFYIEGMRRLEAFGYTVIKAL